MPGCVITLPKTVSERLDLSFGIFARRGEKYSCYTLVLKFVPPAGKVCGVATHAVGRDAGYGLLKENSLSVIIFVVWNETKVV